MYIIGFDPETRFITGIYNSEVDHFVPKNYIEIDKSILHNIHTKGYNYVNEISNIDEINTINTDNTISENTENSENNTNNTNKEKNYIKFDDKYYEVIRVDRKTQLSENKKIKLNELENIKNKVINLDIIYKDNLFQADLESQNLITQNYLIALNTENFKNIEWRTSNNKMVDLTLFDLGEILKLMCSKQTEIKRKYWAIKDLIDEAEIFSDLEIINFSEVDLYSDYNDVLSLIEKMKQTESVNNNGSDKDSDNNSEDTEPIDDKNYNPEEWGDIKDTENTENTESAELPTYDYKDDEFILEESKDENLVIDSNGIFKEGEEITINPSDSIFSNVNNEETESETDISNPQEN